MSVTKPIVASSRLIRMWLKRVTSVVRSASANCESKWRNHAVGLRCQKGHSLTETAVIGESRLPRFYLSETCELTSEAEQLCCGSRHTLETATTLYSSQVAKYVPSNFFARPFVRAFVRRFFLLCLLPLFFFSQ